ncbi:MAG: hypothetical protein A2864_02090 [Candidatus Woykebacteria bacterium RIFCSPHIGHO2_01_FULL_39_12]|uniref:TFIIB-type domain-containing protein n=1 Tax=Candidatus Woykebacteria bacterium RIFCSPHIGHO2_01_FULL_39_12 TaxID=1802599 RepID=A0A1G1WHK2_9BACT|nr:MAG: hypothetical protein A2864_02090 [Candidatus Woykebacteria bacterium RIFCSPHIGHO2_01_FULL_39_12]
MSNIGPVDETGKIETEEEGLRELREGAKKSGQKCPDCGAATATTEEGRVSCSSCGYVSEEVTG